MKFIGIDVDEKKNGEKIFPPVCDFKIRECQIDDYDSIHKLNYYEMGYGYPIDKTKKKLDQFL